MPKILIITLTFSFIIAPRAQILAQEGSFEPEPTNYLPKPETLTNLIIRIPLRIFEFFQQGIPGSKEDWQALYRRASEALETLRNTLGGSKAPSDTTTPQAQKIPETGFSQAAKNFFSRLSEEIEDFVKNIVGKIFK